MTRLSAACLGLLLLGPLPLWAVDSSPTEKLMRIADCIREAGDMKGAKREAFMTECQAAKARAAGESVAPQAGPAATPAAAVAAAPAPAVAAVPADGLPPQERILACAMASKDMQGDPRAAYLKDCLAGRVHNPAIDAEENEHRAACMNQAQAQPAAERRSFVAACISGAGAAAPGVVKAQTVAVSPPDSEPRRRAACNVLAQDRQGAERKTFIEQCVVAQPVADTRASPVAAPASTLSAKERLVRSKQCADEAHAKLAEGQQVMAYMNACMAGRQR